MREIAFFFTLSTLPTRRQGLLSPSKMLKNGVFARNLSPHELQDCLLQSKKKRFLLCSQFMLMIVSKRELYFRRYSRSAEFKVYTSHLASLLTIINVCARWQNLPLVCLLLKEHTKLLHHTMNELRRSFPRVESKRRPNNGAKDGVTRLDLIRSKKPFCHTFTYTRHTRCYVDAVNKLLRDERNYQLQHNELP